jgi:hypothetical protein
VWQEVDNGIHQWFDVGAVGRADLEHIVPVPEPRDRLYYGQRTLTGAKEVGLVDGDDGRRTRAGDEAGDEAVTAPQSFRGLQRVEEQEDDIRLGEADHDLLLHPGSQRVAGLLGAGRIHEDRLVSRAIADAPDRTTGCLRTG